MRLIDRLTGHEARLALDDHPTGYTRTGDVTFVLCELTDPDGPVRLYAIDTQDLVVAA